MTFALTDYTGLFLWLKADALVLSDTDPVSTWTDSSGKGNNATGTTTTRPLYRTNRVNSLPALVFDGTDDFLQTAAIDLTKRECLTLYMVAKSAALNATDQVLIEQTASYSVSSGNFLLYRNSSTDTLQLGINNGGVGVWESWTDPGSAFNLITIRVLRSNRKFTVQIFVNGSYAGFAIQDGPPDTSRLLTNVAWYIGARAGTSLFMNGEIAEIAAYWTAHEPDKRMAVESSLATKYGLTLTPATVAAAFDGHSHTEGDGPSSKARMWWLRALNRVTENIDWVMTARSGTTMEKFADDRLPRDRWLENTLPKRLLTTQDLANDIFYSFSIAKSETHLDTEFARMVASNATHRWARTVHDSSHVSKPGTFDADRATVNTYFRANVPATIDYWDADADPFLGPLLAGTNTNWFAVDGTHINEHPGETYVGEIFTDYLVNTVGLTRWTPAALSTAISLWYDAETIVGSDGDLISQWDDLSGNAKHATAAGALRPTLKRNVLGWPGTPHRDAVRFAGAQCLTVPTTDLSATQAVTIAVVYKSTVAGTDQTIFERTTNINTAPATFGFILIRASGNTIDSVVKGGVGYNTSSLSASGSTLRTVVSVVDKSKSANREVLLRSNGTQAAPTGSSNNTEAFGNVASYIGGRGAASLFLTGDIGEIIVCNRRLTILEMRQLEAYLSMKWGTH